MRFLSGAWGRRVANSQQTDLFGAETAPRPNYRPDPAQVRAKLLDVLAKAKAAPGVPWRSEDQGFYRVVFPQMANWLPAEEADQLRFEFETEMARLQAA